MLYRNRKFVSVLASLTLVLFLVMTSCAPSPGLSPEPSPPVTPEPSPPITPEPSPVAPILTELGLVAEPLTEKRLDVELVYSGGDETGLCYLGSYAMLAKFSDSDITFTDVVANSGIGASALYIPQVNLFMDGSFLRSIGLAARNQGYDYYIAALKGAQITDEFFARDLPKDAKQVVSVESEDEAFKLLKRLISSDIPVEVHLDTFPIKEPLSTYTSYWKGVFEFEGSRHVDHYMTVTGYDERFVYLNDPTEKVGGKGKDIPVDRSDFLLAWKNGNNPSFDDDCRIGPYWMLFLGERGTAKSVSELKSWNLDIAQDAPEEIRKAADNPNISEVMHCNQMYRARKEFASFITEYLHPDAGSKIRQISELFRQLCQSPNPKADLLKIADLSQQVLTPG